MKASIDAAIARDNDIAQLRAELQEAKKREEFLQKAFSNIYEAYKYWLNRSKSQCRERVAVHQSNKLLAEKNAALLKQLSQMVEKEKEALTKLDDLKECLRQPGKEVEA